MRSCRALLLVPLVLTAACAARQARQPWSYDDHLGVVIALADRACFMTKAQSLPARTALRVVDPGTQQERQAFVVTAAESCLDVSAQGTGLRGYSIQFEGAPALPFYGIGIAGRSPRFRASDGSLAADIDGDRREEFFRSCTSAEGVHFTIWTGSPLSGSRRWHHYQPLGYDVIPTCTPAETARQ